SQPEWCQAVLAVLVGKLVPRDRSFLFGVKGTESGRGRRGGAAEPAREDRQAPAADLRHRRRALGLLLAEYAVVVDVQMVEERFHEVVPGSLDRLAVDADVQPHQHGACLAEEDEVAAGGRIWSAAFLGALESLLVRGPSVSIQSGDVGRTPNQAERGDAEQCPMRESDFHASTS